MVITKEAHFGRIQILDEQEPDAGRLGLNMRVALGIYLVENGVKIGQLEDYPMCLNPDSDLTAVCAEVNGILEGAGCFPIPDDVVSRVSNLRSAATTELTQARWKVTSSREVLRRLQVHSDADDLLQIALAQFATTQAELVVLEDATPVGIYKETRLSLMTILTNGTVEIRLRKCVCEDGELISPTKYHRFVLHPGSNRAATIAVVNTHLPTLNDDFGPSPPMSQADMDRIEQICAVEHTAAVITAYENYRTDS